MKDYYYILGINQNSSESEIKKAYRKLSLKFHPDKNKGDKFFESRFKEIQEAYETLSDKNKRNLYDSAFRSRGKYNSKTQEVSEIISFEVSKKKVTADEQVTFFWVTKNITNVHLSCFNGKLPLNGKKTVKISSLKSRKIPVTLTGIGIKGNKITKVINLNYTSSQDEPINSKGKVYNENKQEQTNSKPFENKSSASKGISDINSKSHINRMWYSLPIIFLLGLVYFISNQDKATEIEVETIWNNPPATPELLMKAFFACINNSDFEQAAGLHQNKLWEPYTWKFGDWYKLSEIEILNFKKKEYPSKYDADEILEVEYRYNDGDDIRKDKYDFHIKKIDNLWQIVRMIYPKENETWYNNDPLYRSKDDPKMKLFNRPHVLLQSYYDNFSDSKSIIENSKFYNDTLIVHFKDQMIDKRTALRKDFKDFEDNKIRSYNILVNSYNMITNKYDYFDIVNVPLNYYVTKVNGQRSKFEINITAVLNKANDKILAIGNIIKFDDLIDAIKKTTEVQTTKTSIEEPSDIQVYNANTYLKNGQSPYSYCFGSENICDFSCSKISVKGSYNSDVIVLIKKDNIVVRNAFISKGRKYEFNLANGTYQTFFYYGNSWDNKKYMKETTCGSLYGGFRKGEHFGKDSPQFLNNNILTYELVLQKNGNFSTKSSNINEAF